MKSRTKRTLGAVAFASMMTACTPVPQSCSNWLSGGGHPPPPKPAPTTLAPTTTIPKIADCRVLIQNPSKGSTDYTSPWSVMDMRGMTDAQWTAQCKARGFTPVKINGKINPPAGYRATFHLLHVPVFGRGVGIWDGHPTVLQMMIDDLQFFLDNVIIVAVYP